MFVFHKGGWLDRWEGGKIEVTREGGLVDGEGEGTICRKGLPWRERSPEGRRKKQKSLALGYEG